jgi:hypothetical protein
MRRAVGWLFLLVALGIAAIAIVSVATRFHDGPLGPIPGGLFQGATLDAALLDPAEVARENTIEIEVGQPDPLTRTTWVLAGRRPLHPPAARPTNAGRNRPRPTVACASASEAACLR